MQGALKHGAVAFLILCGCILYSLYLLHEVGRGAHGASAIDDIDSGSRHRSYSSDPLLYAIAATSTYKQKFADVAFGGIVSHHLLANIDISNFFAEFSDQEIERVVIIGPNHYYPNAFPFLSTVRAYTTPFGDVRVDAETVAHLVNNKIVEISPDILQEEHSISSLVPYVSAYFPNAEIVPIVVSARASKIELNKISEFLTQTNTARTIVVASVDFSHHLYSNASQIHDERSIAAIQNFDYDSLFKLEVDSPGSLYVLLKYLEAKGAKNLSMQQQSSAAIFDKYDSDDVTSYVFAHARKGDQIHSMGVSVLFFGDIMLGRGTAHKSNLFSKISGPEGNFLKGYDAVIGNLEGAVEREHCDIHKDDLLISPNDLLMLTKNNFTHVGIANNHFERCPYDASAQQIFDDLQLIPIDDSGSIVAGTNGNVEVVSFFASPVPPDVSAIRNRVRELSARGNTIVVNMHWGIEYDTEPTMRERELAKMLIDAGARVIIGHHPHVVQPVELYKNGLIFYSLGNFLSDQTGKETQTGFAVGLFVNSEYIRATVFPFVQQNGIPTHVEQSAARDFCENLYRGDDTSRSKDHPCIITVRR